MLKIVSVLVQSYPGTTTVGITSLFLYLFMYLFIN
jgi:hypothetical protein